MDVFWQKKGGAKSSDNAEYSETNFKKRKRYQNVGRPNSLDGDRLCKLLEAYYSHPYSLRELADMFGVSRMTVWRAVQETEVPEGVRA